MTSALVPNARIAEKQVGGQSSNQELSKHQVEKETHKKLRLVFEKPLSEPELRALKELDAILSAEDFHLETEKNLVTFYVKSLDMDKLRKSVEDIIRRHELLPVDNNPLSNILEKIESIGSYSFRGHRRVFVGYNKERKVSNRKDKERERGMYYYAQKNNFQKLNAKVPAEYLNRIICDDAESVLKNLPDNCVDLILTSPPYNFGLKYESHKDEVHWDKYFQKLFAVFDECIRVTKFGGRIIVNVQPLFSDYIPIHHLVSNFFIQKKLIWKGEILWEKHNYSCKYTAWGSWKSPSNPYLKYTWEFLEVFCKGSLKHSSEGSADISGDEFKKWVYAKWEILPETRMKKWDHPAMFPEELVTRSLKLFSFKGDVVLDPFNGVGTTTKVAKELGRAYLGIDSSQEYSKKAESRLFRVG